jgi:hypothetical protein
MVSSPTEVIFWLFLQKTQSAEITNFGIYVKQRYKTPFNCILPTFPSISIT